MPALSCQLPLRRYALLLTALLLAPMLASAQDALPLQRLTGAVTLDGLSDEEAWQRVQPLALTMYEPTFEGTPTEKTEILIAYDEAYLYVAGRLYDEDAAGIRANSLYRDRYSGDDVFAVILDTFNDNENALWFFTTPAGVRFDTAIANDAEFGNGPPLNESWNSYWDAATLRTEEGWFAEMRIPFSSLGFQDNEGRVVMGLIAYRYIARKNERHIYPAIPPNWGMGFGKPSQARDVILSNVRSQKPLYLTPYVLGGFGQDAQLNASETAYHLDERTTEDLGFDLKYNLTSNLTLDATVNTDFAQVEADDQQVNLTRFSLFFPEKRSFFQERAGLFDFNTSGASRLFHSRQIGLANGSPVRLLGGARLVGRAGKWDLGLLDMQTNRNRALPSENFGVVRLRRQVLNAYSYAGGMVTSRLGDDGSYNVAYGLDGIVRLFGDEYLTLKWAQTFEEEFLKNDTYRPLEAGRLMAEWQRRKSRGLSYQALAVWSGEAYTPGIGFVTRRNFTSLGGNVIYDKFAGASSPVRRTQPGLWGTVYLNNEDGLVESARVQHFTSVELKNGSWLFLGPTVRYENVPESFSFSADADVPAGRYTFWDLWGGYYMSTATLFRANIDLRVGTFYDGWWVWNKWTPTWSLSEHLEIQTEYEVNLIRFTERNQRFDTHIGRLRLQGALNTHFSLNAFLQYSSAADVFSINARFRYHFREGNDLWLVYNEGLNTDRHLPSQPPLLLTNSRTFLLKYTYTFAL